MKTHLKIHAESGAMVLVDRDHFPPPEVLMDPDRTSLRKFAERGDLFFLDAEDPADFRVLLGFEEDSGLPRHRYRHVGGCFLLNLPSGELVVTGGHEFRLEPGAYAVTVLEQAVVDADAINKERRAVLTPEQWRYRRWVAGFAAVGCLAFLAAWIIVFIYQFSMISLVALGIALLAFAPSWVLGRTSRYRKTEQLLSEHGLSFPSHALIVRSVSDPSGLVGGHVVF